MATRQLASVLSSGLRSDSFRALLVACALVACQDPLIAAQSGAERHDEQAGSFRVDISVPPALPQPSETWEPRAVFSSASNTLVITRSAVAANGANTSITTLVRLNGGSVQHLENKWVERHEEAARPSPSMTLVNSGKWLLQADGSNSFRVIDLATAEVQRTVSNDELSCAVIVSAARRSCAQTAIALPCSTSEQLRKLDTFAGPKGSSGAFMDLKVIDLIDGHLWSVPQSAHELAVVDFLLMGENLLFIAGPKLDDDQRLVQVPYKSFEYGGFEYFRHTSVAVAQVWKCDMSSRRITRIAEFPLDTTGGELLSAVSRQHIAVRKSDTAFYVVNVDDPPDFVIMDPTTVGDTLGSTQWTFLPKWSGDLTSDTGRVVWIDTSRRLHDPREEIDYVLRSCGIDGTDCVSKKVRSTIAFSPDQAMTHVRTGDKWYVMVLIDYVGGGPLTLEMYRLPDLEEVPARKIHSAIDRCIVGDDAVYVIAGNEVSVIPIGELIRVQESDDD